MMAVTASAPSTNSTHWNQIDWNQVEAFVYRMQVRIAKSIREGKWGKAKALLRILTRSYYARLLAVKKICSNKGSRTAGIDGVLWKTTKQRLHAALNLRVTGYRAEALRRIYIPKKNGAPRPLGIPTLRDRAMQMLFAFGLIPIAETTADEDSYGFRGKRSLHDAVKRAFQIFHSKASAQWVLEADIKACFDRIDHDWLLDNIPLPRRVLGHWLRCGFMEASTLHETKAGTPQGGIISPILCNMTLDGLEEAIYAGRKTRRLLKVIRYADDFVIACNDKEKLLQTIKPRVEAFLRERGLELSESKTKLSHINDGFNFLGVNVRKYNGKLLIKPEDGKPARLLENVRETLDKYRGVSFHVALSKVNSVVRGWAYAYRKVVSKERMTFIDERVYHLIRKWLMREHRSKTWAWISRRHTTRNRGRIEFYSEYFTKMGEPRTVYLFLARDLPIRYHDKIRKEARLFDPQWDSYFQEREEKQRKRAIRDRIFIKSHSFTKLVA